MRGLMFALLLPAIVLHEVAHGYMAYRLGDTTAKDRGRLTLNPIKHIDLFGTILLPLLMIAIFGFGFGYAKPVPINPHRFRDYRKGLFLTGIAGPSANLGLALAGAVIVRFMEGFGMDVTPGGELITVGFYLFAYMNLMLMFFNLIPLPPLDGSRILPLFLSDRAMVTYGKFEQYGFVIIVAILWLGPRVLGFDPIGAYFDLTVNPIMNLLVG
ncbi:MAG: site-2 protease family protein [Actinobacteria bacterium HGW-Actinobacteria-10]|nr:MAG: site-2 protease family protein [Actinobacteria bacterium HGW-Actinobacteria-10]